MATAHAQENSASNALLLNFAEKDVAANVYRQAHSAIQWLTRLSNSYAELKPENAHLILRWDEDNSAIVSQAIAPGTTVELQPHKFLLQFRQNGTATPHAVTLDDTTSARVEAWCLIELLHRELDRDRLSKDLPYNVDALMNGDSEDFETFGQEDVFEQFGVLIAGAATMLKSAGQGSAAVQVDPSDFAVFTVNGSGAQIGLCLGDQEAGQAYYFRSKEVATLSGSARSSAAQSEIVTAEAIAATGKSVDDIAAFLAG